MVRQSTYIQTIGIVIFLLAVGFLNLSAQSIKLEVSSAQDILNQNTGKYDVEIGWSSSSSTIFDKVYLFVYKKNGGNPSGDYVKTSEVNGAKAHATGGHYLYTFPLDLEAGRYNLRLYATIGNTGSDSTGITMDIGKKYLIEYVSDTSVITWLKDSFHNLAFKISSDEGKTWSNKLPTGWKFQYDFSGNIASYTSKYSFDDQKGEFRFTPNKGSTFTGYFSIINEQNIRVNGNNHIVHFRVFNCSKPPAIVHGTVKDKKGNSLHKGSVTLHGENGTGGQDGIVAIIANGSYRFLLDPDNYYIKCSVDGYLTKYYNNVIHPAQAEPLTVVCNDTIRIDFALDTIPPSYKVSGVVKDKSTQKPIVNADVFFIPEVLETDDLIFASFTDEDGNYVAEVHEGKYIVYCGVPSDSPDLCYTDIYYDGTTDRTQAAVLLIKGNRNDINFELQVCEPTDNSITGTVRDSSNTPISATVVAFRLPEKIEELASLTTYSAVTQDGAFNFEKLKIGTYVFFALPQNGSTIPGFYKENDFAVLEWEQATKVKVTANSTEQIEIMLRSLTPSVGSGGIRGWVRKEGGNIKADDVQATVPVNGAITYAIDENGVVRDFALTNGEGLFELSNLKKGKYTLHIERVGYTASISEFELENNETIKEVEKVLVPAIISEIRSESGYDITEGVLIPNPADASLKIEFDSDTPSDGTIVITDIVGNRIMESKVHIQAGKNNIELNTSELSTGAYSVSVITLQKSATLPLMIIR